jgi:hypothetical protein
LEQIYNYTNDHPTTTPVFIFEYSKDAALHNAIILENYNYNLHHIIETQRYSSIYYGSEFKPYQILQPLLQSHPLWPYIYQILSKGATFPLHPISNDQRILDNNFHFTRGNHKSAAKFSLQISANMKEEVERGFAIILPKQLALSIPSSSIAPLRMHEQWTINAQGDRVPKLRMTHDLSFPGPSGLSVNKRVIQELLPPLVYGFALKRVLHYIISLRSRHPKTPILINKFDYDAAYRCCTLSAQTATECITIHEDFAFIALRLTFGGAPCPNLWSCLSESGTDIANMLIQNPHWDHNKLFDPLSTILPAPELLPDDIPFTQAQPLSVTIPVNDIGKADIYIDDTITISLGENDNVNRVSTAIPLAIHTISQPLNTSDPIPCKDIISLRKFTGEGRPSEVKTCLVWVINTRLLRIFLPMDKHFHWSSDIKKIIQTKKVTEPTLDSIIGRLNHVASVYEMMRHFFGRIRQALFRTKSNKWTSLRNCEKDDLEFMLQFLDHLTFTGVPINNVVFRKPSHVYRSDSSLFGLGGYNIVSGTAWRFKLPIECRLCTTLNSLEFIAAIISIWVDAIHDNIPTESCLLSQTDSTSCAGWLRKSNFCDSESEVVQLKTAKQLAMIVMKTESCLYSQWFAGSDNSVADACSRDFHLSDAELTHLIYSYIPSQVPFGFNLCPLPVEITSWLTSLLLQQPFSQQWSQEPTRSKLSLGKGTHLICTPSQSRMTPTWTTSPHTNESTSLVLSPRHYKAADSILTELIQSSPNNVMPPSIAWHRPTSWQTNPIRDLTSMENIHSFYFDSIEDITI